jgi:hypothetical protein
VPNPKLSPSQVRSLMLAKLEDSGLQSLAGKLGYTAFTSAELIRKYPDLTQFPLAGFVLPYFDINGKDTGFFRYRFLEEPVRTGFSALVSHKVMRYVQPTGAEPRAYFPRTFDWRAFFAKPADARRLIITEGELKAACAVKHGIPTIGLGGVWNFKSKEDALIEDLAGLPWEDMTTFICYDSDAINNPQVLKAENALARQLLDRKADVYIIRLPELDQSHKTGLDDLLVADGVETFAKLVEEAEQWAASRELRRLNEQYLMIRKSVEVMDVDTLDIYSTSKFRDLCANRTYMEITTVEMPNGGTAPRSKEKSAALEWIKWPGRAEVGKLVYEPGHELVLSNGGSVPDFNLWSGWGTEPKEGDVALFLELVDFLMTDCTQPERKWFLDWLAYPIQNPGAKMKSCALFHGRQGTGKTILGEIVSRIYGENAHTVDDAKLLSQFNTWARHRQFICGDEIGVKVRKAADLMKGFITRELVSINSKFVQEYTIRDCMNYYFTSNHPDAAYLEEDDRRHFVIKVPDTPKPQAFYDRLGKFLEGDGPAWVMRFLLDRDLKEFNPDARPPLTAAKAAMIDTSRSDAAEWAATLRDNPDKIFGPLGGAKRLASPEALHGSFVDAHNHTLGSMKTMKSVLQENGFVQANRGTQFWVNNGWGLQRLWVLDKSFNNATVAELRRLFLQDYGPGKPNFMAKVHGVKVKSHTQGEK